MRDRLIELISYVQYMGGLEEKLADYLLENGVICPPVKVGDTVYWVTVWDGYATQKDHKEIVNSITVNENDIYFSTKHKTFKLSDFRKSWFTDKNEQSKVVGIMQKARKEAEKALGGVQE